MSNDSADFAGARSSTFLSVASHVFLIAVAVVVLYPVLWVLRMALTPSQAFASGLSPIPEHASLQNFVDVVGHTDLAGHWLFGRQLLNSLVVSGGSAVVGVALATSAAYALSRFAFPGRRLGLGALLATQMFPGTMMMIPLYILLDKLSLLDTQAGLILVYATTSIPFSTWLLKGYFDTIPVELEEAARMDGASTLRIFVSIIIPLARPAIAITALFSFMTAWNEFILAAKLMNAEMSYTLPVVLQSYVGQKSTAWGHFAAGAVVVSAPVMILFFFLQKSLVEGLTAGSVKG
ncbi:MAG TPA: sugar ABC transporter permease [Myxococcota bacterium]|jgi:arabinogalactan oligomer/maltooligosaccharide transport system permease protein